MGLGLRSWMFSHALGHRHAARGEIVALCDRNAGRLRQREARARAKGLLEEGTIGEVLAVDFQWLLDTTHGADYFRRWHRRKERSGGLLVHKASHHFDLVNWWIGSVPERIFATGDRRYYVPELDAPAGPPR